jgi:diaminopimelate decarboxylase
MNPDVDAHTHAKITTGTSANKFGIPIKQAAAAYEAASKYPNIKIRGIQSHIGSQITEVGPFVETLEKLAPLAAELKERYGISYISIGGGDRGRLQGRARERAGLVVGIPARGEAAADARGLRRGARARGAQELGLKVLLEPGPLDGRQRRRPPVPRRVPEARPGKELPHRRRGHERPRRPAMYDSYHEIVPLQRDTTRRALVADIVGPICETTDCFAKDRQIQELGEGEYLAIMSAGAYGHVMASRYNARPIPAEVLVKGSAFEQVGARETFEQMIANEKIPAFLK